jgi:diacylglycerol kinase (ATP)
MSPWSVIANPVAGKGAGQRALDKLRILLKSRGIDYVVTITEHVGHATELARAAEGNMVVAVGGDGTINEVVNGLVGSGKALAVIPAGSGNDFVKALGVPKDVAAAFGKIVEGKRLNVDVGVVACGPTGSTHLSRCFINGVGIGFDAAVAAQTKKIKHLSGFAVYLVAVLQTLGRYRSPVFNVTVDEWHRAAQQLLIAIGNGPCAGGGFFLTPRAEIDDGQMDVCLVDDVSILRILTIMPLVMMGKHLKAKEVKYLRGRRLSISSSDGFYVHADGEIVGENVNEVVVGLHPQKLDVIVA